MRRIEFASPRIWIPAAIFFSLGLILEWASLATPARTASTVLGILGITFLWDSLELIRQQRRVRKGHAPANPHNPRHAALLAEPGSHATTLDMLKRDPLGKTVRPNAPIKSVTDY